MEEETGTSTATAETDQTGAVTGQVQAQKTDHETIEDRLAALEASAAQVDHEAVATLKEEWPKLKAALEAHGIRLP